MSQISNTSCSSGCLEYMHNPTSWCLAAACPITIAKARQFICIVTQKCHTLCSSPGLVPSFPPLLSLTWNGEVEMEVPRCPCHYCETVWCLCLPAMAPIHLVWDAERRRLWVWAVCWLLKVIAAIWMEFKPRDAYQVTACVWLPSIPYPHSPLIEKTNLK